MPFQVIISSWGPLAEGEEDACRQVSPRSVNYTLHPELSQNSAISIRLQFKKVKKTTSSFKERKKERKICSKLSCVCF